jgi:hypothetical protein
MCHTISSFIEAMLGIAVASENNNVMATVFQSHSGIDNESFSASDAQIGVKEDDSLLLSLFCHGDVALLVVVVRLHAEDNSRQTLWKGPPPVLVSALREGCAMALCITNISGQLIGNIRLSLQV